MITVYLALAGMLSIALGLLCLLWPRRCTNLGSGPGRGLWRCQRRQHTAGLHYADPRDGRLVFW